VSDTLPRSSSTTAGEAGASTAAATSPAAGEDSRRTARYSTSTVSTPSTICGSTIAHVCTPNIRTDSACSQNAPGSSSSVIVCAGSNAPNANACQSPAIACTAAA
jgi:hypothetical protein